MIKLLSFLGTLALASGPIISISNYSNASHTANLTNNDEISSQFVQKQNNNLDPNSNLFGSGSGIIGHDATKSEIEAFSNLVPNYQWFTKLNSVKSFGYTDLNSLQGTSGKGLCEYISLSTILTYQELFVSSGFFNDDEWNKQYFKNNSYSDKASIPIHKYYKDNNYDQALSYNLYKITGKVDLWWGKDISATFRNFLNNKAIKAKVSNEYCASVMHSSSPEDKLLQYNVPVMVSFTKNGGHNVVIYGYDSKTKSYLVHYGWAGHPAVIIKKSEIWSFWKGGFWNAFYFNSSATKNSPRKAFKYKNENYNWEELKNLGISWDQVPNE